MISYWIVLFVAVAESLAFIGLIIPGTFFIILVGFLAASGVLDLGDLIWFAAAGAILGDGISFYLGRQGIGLFKKESRIFRLDYLEKGERFFRQYGGKSVFLGRFIGPIRPVIPFVAGILKMRRRDFFLYNIASAFLWAPGCLLLGYFFGGIWKTIVLWSTRAELFLLVIFIIIGVFSLVKWLVMKKGKRFFLLVRSLGASIRHAFIENEEVKHIIARHPSFFHFLKNRFQRGEVTGLPLTLGVTVGGYLLFSLFGIIESILQSGMVVEIDVRVENLLFMFRNPFFLSLFTWISIAGKWYVLAVFSFLFSIFLWYWRKKKYIVLLWVTLLGSQALVTISKLAVHRARPELAFYLEDSFSFPSGHATVSMAFYGFLVYVTWKTIKSWNRKVNISFLGFVIIFFIGFSRLYLGVHYVSDVLGGYILGLLWIIFSVHATSWILCLKKKEKEIGEEAKVTKVFWGLFGIAAVSFAIFGSVYQPLAREVKPREMLLTVGHDPLEIFSEQRLSRYSEKLSGLPQAPISFILQAENDETLVNIFQESGWYIADDPTAQSLLQIASSVILNKSYPTAPMTPSFWNSQVHDFGFEKPTDKDSVRARHHARFWKTGVKTAEEKNIYVGVASLDVGIKYVVAHRISPDIDTEREFVFKDLAASGVAFTSKKEKLVDPVLGKNAAGDQFFTDGEAYVIDIK